GSVGEGWVRSHSCRVLCRCRAQEDSRRVRNVRNGRSSRCSFARHSCEGRKRFTTAELVIQHRRLWSSPRTLSQGCRLRSGRFDRLPTLKSLFFCWPKRKVTQRKWPLEREPRSIARG